jgi:hypothetical protein
METSRLDRLAKVLATRQPRRAALALLAGLGLGLREGQTQGDSRVRSQADRNRRTRQGQCKPAGVKCIHNPKKGTNPTGKLCRKCCETFRKVNKKTGVCCIPNGQPCSSDTQCCLQSCSVGRCQPTTIIPIEPFSPPPIGIGDVNSGGTCVAVGSACLFPGDCCPPASGVPILCPRGVCCVAINGICSSNAECCPTALGDPVPCTSGRCCLPYGRICSSAAECCLLLDGTPIPCSGGLCRFN